MERWLPSPEPRCWAGPPGGPALPASGSAGIVQAGGSVISRRVGQADGRTSGDGLGLRARVHPASPLPPKKGGPAPCELHSCISLIMMKHFCACQLENPAGVYTGRCVDGLTRASRLCDHPVRPGSHVVGRGDDDGWSGPPMTLLPYLMVRATVSVRSHARASV